MFERICRWLQRRRDARREYKAHGWTFGNMVHDWVFVQAARRRLADGDIDGARGMMRHCKINRSPDGTPYSD